MSKIRDDYESSLWNRLTRWVDGETDPYQGKMEMQPLREADVTGDSVYNPDRLDRRKVDRYLENTEKNKEIKAFRILYSLGSVALCLLLIAVLLLAVSWLPVLGDPNGPNNNEVSARYVEKGMEESGAVNMVTNMILSYRGFDTFGETCVLFIAATCVIILLRKNEEELENAKETDWKYEPKPDAILQKMTLVLVPIIFLYGFYIILNGHLSPGGGFSGGAVLGSGLILYLNAFGFKRTERFFTEKVYRRVTLGALTFYCLAKSYSFFTGANHLKSGIPLGTPGAIISSGLILPLNICVGLVVACTMYAFYTLFRKGGM